VRNWWGLLLVLGGVAWIFSLLPLGTALEFVADERYEVIKGFLCSKGFVLYQQIWNDQPPVLTMVLSAAFKFWGPTILTARLVAAGFGLALFAVFYGLVRQRSPLGCALLATFFLLASPGVLLLSASVMLEVPTIATALLSAWLVRQWCERRHWGWLLAGGAAMGLALQIKLTAVVVLPAILVQILINSRADFEWRWVKARLREGVLFGTALVVIFLLIGFTWGHGSLGTSFRSHLAEHSAAGLGSPSDFPFDLRVPVQHFDCVVPALTGLVLLVKRRDWRQVLFPTVLLATVSLIHAVHRPWWNYYYLHFAVPLAWLAGWTLVEIIAAGSRSLTGPFQALALRTWKGAALCALAALFLARSETRLEAGVRQMRESPKTNASAVLATMRRYAPQTHWAYAEPVIYPFHARLLVPPELAVVMAKRAWSGQISIGEMLKICERYKPEQILLPNGRIPEEWGEFLKSEYDIGYADREFVLYVAAQLIR
jgi:4-amino-4-deoxy-L-arabinose transferase-like glycosyltransferase